jgi:hypothetical protein
MRDPELNLYLHEATKALIGASLRARGQQCQELFDLAAKVAAMNPRQVVDEAEDEARMLQAIERYCDGLDA